MVDKNDVEVQIKFNYENNEKSIKLQEELPYDKLKDKAIELFGIPKDKKNYLTISYYDNDQDLIQVEENDSIFDLADEKTNNLYYLELFVENDLTESRRTQNTIKSYESNKNDDSEIINKNNQIIEDLNNKINNKEQENKNLKIENEKIKNEIKQIKYEIKQIKNENEKIKNEYKILQDEMIIKKNNENKNEEKENEKLKKIIESKNNENETLKKKIEEVLKIRELEKEINEVRKRKEQKKKNKEIMEHMKTIEEYKQKLESLKIKKYINNIIPIIENNILDIIKQNITKLENNINNEVPNENDLNKIIEENKDKIIKYYKDDIKNKIIEINNNLEKINNDIKLINNKINYDKKNEQKKELENSQNNIHRTSSKKMPNQNNINTNMNYNNQNDKNLNNKDNNIDLQNINNNNKNLRSSNYKINNNNSLYNERDSGKQNKQQINQTGKDSTNKVYIKETIKNKITGTQRISFKKNLNPQTQVNTHNANINNKKNDNDNMNTDLKKKEEYKNHFDTLLDKYYNDKLNNYKEIENCCYLLIKYNLNPIHLCENYFLDTLKTINDENNRGIEFKKYLNYKNNTIKDYIKKICNPKNEAEENIKYNVNNVYNNPMRRKASSGINNNNKNKYPQYKYQ